MSHKCSDGRHSKLTRTGPVGSEGPDVLFSCPRCGWSQDAASMRADHERAFAAIRAAIKDGSFR